jgi:hypothetical protein
MRVVENVKFIKVAETSDLFLLAKKCWLVPDDEEVGLLTRW